VANNIGLSPRQLQREDKIAVDILGETLWRTYNLQDRIRTIPDSEPAPSYPVNGENTVVPEQSLEWLKTTTPSQPTDISKEIQDVIFTLKGVLKASNIKVSYRPEKENPLGIVYLQTPILRQALLNVLNTCISLVPEGRIHIQTIFQTGLITIRFEIYRHTPEPIHLESSQSDSLSFASQLIHLCGGTLQTSQGEIPTGPKMTAAGGLVVQINLPAMELYTILVVEDHPDTLELYRRNLAGSRYRFIGAQDGRAGFSLAKEMDPKVIILDVMMPEKDGWSFLGQLKVHPKTSHIPVIISSVLQQANLAQTLGAAEFLLKPVSRLNLLSALDRQMERLATKSD